MARLLKLGLALLMAGSGWYYFEAIVIPYQQKEAGLHHTPRGNLSDLYPRWLGARELLLHGRDPYSAEVTREIQMGFYGQPLDGSRADLPKDEERFAYPVYVVFLLAPTIAIPFPIVRVLFQLLLMLLTAASVPLWQRGLGMRMERTTTAIIVVLLIGSLPVVEGLHLEQLTLLVCFLIAASCAALASRRLVPAGILLAIATIKPQIAVAVVAWFGLWALGDWARRQGLVWAFAASMALLWLGAEAMLPGWLGRWWTALHAYLGYNDGRSLLENVLGRYPGLLLSAVIATAICFVCWRSRHASAGSYAFGTCLVSVLAGCLLIKPGFPLYDVAMLLPVVLWLSTQWKPIRKRSRTAAWLYCLTAFFLVWQWVGALGLTALSLLYSSSAAQRAWQLAAVGRFSFPLGISFLLGLLAADMCRSRAPLLGLSAKDGEPVPATAGEVGA